MKVACLIDSLGSGGAQRQLCAIAVLLKQQGCEVSMLTYHPIDFFQPLLEQAGIPCICLRSRRPWRHALAVRRALRRGKQDVVLAFLPPPALYAELAGLPRRDWGLVVSERSAERDGFRGCHRFLRRCHRFADYLTTNSHTNRLLLERHISAARQKTITIYNTVDLREFAYVPPQDEEGRLRIVVAASYRTMKNPAGFVRAVALARARLPGADVQLDWYGGFRLRHDGVRDLEAFNAANHCIVEHGLRDCVRLHEPRADIAAAYRAADAVALPSFFEGLPNSICEGMSVGRPILMSNVCDAGNLVADGENGFLFNPASPEDMARAIVKLAKKTPAERRQMGLHSRRFAERLFDPQTIARRYMDVLTAAAERKNRKIEHWTPEAPESAHQSLCTGVQQSA
jgi:glycosyltransferase involved in cell wall biosynthesis